MIYIAPQYNSDYYNECFEYVAELANTSSPVITMGDFNLPDTDWLSLSASTMIANQFCDLVFNSNLAQLVDLDTHIHGNILDLVLTNAEDIIHSLTIDCSNSTFLRSDHFVINVVSSQFLKNKVTENSR